MKIEQSELIRMIKESISELSNQTIGSAVQVAGDKRRDVQRDSIIIKKLNEVNFANSFRIQMDGNYFTFKMEFSNEINMFVIQVHVNRPSGFYLCNLMPENIHTTPRGEDITETEVGYVIDNLKAGYRAKLQNMRREAIELNQSMKEKRELNENVEEDVDHLVFDLTLCAKNNRKINDIMMWVARALAKKVNKGLVPELEHLANCSTMQKISKMAIDSYAQMRRNSGDVMPIISREIRAAIRKKLAEFILAEVDEMVNIGGTNTVKESLNELSNQTIGSYMRSAQNQRRDKQYNVGKSHAINTINDKYKFSVTLEDGETVLFSLGMNRTEFYIIADVDEGRSYQEPYTYELRADNPRCMLDGTPITETLVGYVIDNLRAGERMKLKGLCQAAIELNQGLSGEQQVAESVNEKAVSKTQHIVTVNKPILRKIIKETIINYLNLK